MALFTSKALVHHYARSTIVYTLLSAARVEEQTNKVPKFHDNFMLLYLIAPAKAPKISMNYFDLEMYLYFNEKKVSTNS